MDSYEGSSLKRNFTETVLPDTSVIFSYIFENISQLNGPIQSPSCYINNLPWRILLMVNPQTPTMSALTHKKNLSIYLQCNSENDASNWSCYATADISLMPMVIGNNPITKSIKHLFSPKENDWGFKCFETFDFILHPDNGYCINDSIAVQMQVNAEIPHGVFWDSKKHTGFVGLTNQGATCYMNSLLQTIFFTNELRRAIYCMPTEADDSKKSVAFALQRVFYDLQFCDKPVGTKRLTNSFGWDTMDSFMQHDVQEFLRVLLAKIETKMKGTSLEGIVPKLFAGKMCSYIRCKNVEYNSSREETFYDIQLSVKSKKNIYESFQDYVAPEILTGENKYFAGEYGLQEAEKGVIFKSLPPVLHLHLMRFQYDSWNDICVKFNDYFEFYENIDLSNYLDLKDSPDEKDKKALTEYRLHAVLVHSGDNHGGHYVVYINVDAKGKWYKFDDDLVSICTAKEAIEQNYGGSEEELKNNKTFSSAYMLSYIQVSEIPNILKEITENDINSEFLEHLNEVKRIDDAERCMKYNQNIITANIVLEDNFDIEDMQNFLTSTKISYITFKIDVGKTLNDFLDMVSNSFKMSKTRFRLWPLLLVHDYVRPIFLDCTEQNLGRPLQSLKELRNPWYLLLQFSSPLNLYQIQNFDPKQQVLLLCKLFQDVNELHFLGISFRYFQDQISEVTDEVRKILEGLEDLSDCDFKVYEENSGLLLNSFDTLDKSFKLKKTETNCFVLVFEKIIINKPAGSPSYQDFKSVQHNRVEVFFIDKADKSKVVSFSLQLAENLTLEQMALEVGKKINMDKNKVLFFRTNSTDSPPLKIDSLTYLKDIFHTRSGLKLFYHKLSMDVNQLQNKVKFPIIYLSPNLREEKEIIVYVDKNSYISDVIRAVKVELKISESTNETSNEPKYRLVGIENNYIARHYTDYVKLSDLDQFYDANQQVTVRGFYRIEEISKNESTCQLDSSSARDCAGGCTEESILVPVMHFNKSVRNSFGIPFFVTVKSEQTFEQICDQIRKKLCIPEVEWSTKFKICLVIPQTPYNIKYLEEDDLQKPVVFEHFRENFDGSFKVHIGLDHVSKMQRKSRELVEKSLKIYN